MDVYKFRHHLTWMNGDKSVAIPDESINQLVFEFDYAGKKNFPIIVITLNIDKELTDNIILNKDTAIMVMSSEKYIDKENIFPTKYIHTQFKYVVLQQVNSTKDLDYEQQTGEKRQDIYRKINIGLMQIDHINMIKRYSNNVFNNASPIDIIALNTAHMNMVIEPSKNTKRFSSLIVPPTESIPRLISYVDELANLYPTPYLFFVDFDYTYLLSTSGTVVPVDKSINEVIINIHESDKVGAADNGLLVDTAKKVFILNAASTLCKVSLDGSKGESFNRIMGISSNGKTKTVNVAINNSKFISPKFRIVNVSGGNLDKIEQLKVIAERSALTVRVSKDDVDISVFTPNKRYTINHIKAYQEHNGSYMLMSKSEFHIRKGQDFSTGCELVFKKIKS